jgi:hypothetical protein
VKSDISSSDIWLSGSEPTSRRGFNQRELRAKALRQKHTLTGLKAAVNVKGAK